MPRKRTSNKERQYLPIADAMAVRQGATDEEIFAALGGAVSMSWLIRKRKEHDWDARHAEMQSSAAYITETMRRKLMKTVQLWDADDGAIDGKMADQFAKIVTSIDKLEGTWQTLASVQIIMDHFVEYLTTEAKDQTAYDVLVPHILEFTQYIRAKYNRGEA